MRTLPILLCLLLLLSCSDGGRSRHALDALEARNQSDSLLTDSVLALRLADYFDRHGTANERLHAHYLLARTWADLGQSPRALDEFHKAAEQADTTNLDSVGYHYLSRVYGQMGELLYNHQLPHNALHAYQTGAFYAKAGNEIAVMINLISQKAKCYYHLNLKDSTYSVIKETTKMFYDAGDTLAANTNLTIIAYMMIESGQYEKAKEYMDLYENHSYFRKELLPYNENWKLFYAHKGFYYIGINKLDSALYWLYEELNISTDPNNRVMAYQGLYRAYELKNKPDSVKKYAILYAETNDLTNKQSTAAALLSLQHIYDYNQFKTLAEKKASDAENANRRAWILLVLMIAFAIITWFGIIHLRERNKLKIQRLNAKYATDLLMYSRAKEELLKQQEEDSMRRQELEQELDILKKSIMLAHGDGLQPEQWGLSDFLLKSPIVNSFHQAAAQGKVMPDESWIALRKLCNLMIPNFMDDIKKFDYKPDIMETQICILTKLRFLISEITILLNISSSLLAHRRKRLLKKMFGIDGSSTEFDTKIYEMAI